MLACDGGPAAPGDPELALSFSVPSVDLVQGSPIQVSLQNTGTAPVGPVDLFGSTVRDAGGNAVIGAGVRAEPATIATLNPGTSALVEIHVSLPGTVQAGAYSSTLTARAGSDATTTLEVQLTVASNPFTDVASLDFDGPPAGSVQGDVVRFVTTARDGSGAPLPGVQPLWSVSPASRGAIDAEGRFVGYGSGSVTITATAGAASVSHQLAVTARSVSGQVTLLGQGSSPDRYTSDVWVHGSHAYTGTWSTRTFEGVARAGNELRTWDISTPSAPARTHTLALDARTVNDVKVRADGQLAVATHEGSNDGRNGITLLDLADPAQPAVITRYTDGLESGIHNVWIEDEYAYLVLDGVGSGLRVLDISDPAQPTPVASFYGGDSFLHDVVVEDGLAFLSHWNAGLIILDVGNGVAGGSPTNPIEVSRITDLDGQTHNAWYWPEAGYVFVGEEDYSTPGIMRVVDVRDLSNPQVVATFQAPGATPHNFWLDEATGTLYLAWYGNGLLALDVTGELRGELDRQGRQRFAVRYDGTGSGCGSPEGTCAWAPQLHEGRIFVSDINNGLVVLQPSF